MVAADAGREAALSAHYRHCADLLQAFDRDRWLACLFAPEPARHHLHALYAFSLEIARIRETASDPGPGEIRMQWWVDAIEGEARGDVRSHPVADALISTIRTCSLPRAAFTALVEARRFDLYDDPMPDLEALEAYCGTTASVLFRLASIILAEGREPGGAQACGYAGVAYAITGLLRAFPWQAARGQLFIPATILDRHGVASAAAVIRPAAPGLLAAMADLRAHALHRFKQARAGLNVIEPIARSAFLPLAPLLLYHKAMERTGYHPFSSSTDVSQWRRQWAMWKMSKERLSESS